MNQIYFDMIMPQLIRKQVMKKELLTFTVIFLVLAIGMHFKEWMDHPVEHLMALPDAGAYGIGALHPLVFTLIVYIVFVLLRSIIRLLKR
jgi:hypothetical protein